MKAMFWTGPRRLELRHIPIPVISTGEVLLKVNAAGVCKTDYHIYTGQFAHCEPPCVLGHEIAAEIADVGTDVFGWKKGDRVCVETSIGCGHCHHCTSGNRSLCKDMQEIGYAPHQGAYAEYLKAPAANLIRIPDNVSDREAAIVESVVCPVGALMRLGVKFGETCVVYGVGPAGIAFIQGAKAMGAGRVVAVARNQDRLEQAARFGADVLINSSKEDVLLRILELTNGEGAELVCDATGAPKVIEQAFDVARNLGRVILYGIPADAERVELPVTKVIIKQLQLFGAVGNIAVWEPLLTLVSLGRINLRDMVTHTFHLEELSDAFALLESKTENPIKVVTLP